MKRILIFLAIILGLGSIFLYYHYYYRYTPKSENSIESFDSVESFDGLPITAYTNPSPNQQLRNPSHLPSTVYRVTNTILTAATVFYDAMDKLDLPAQVADEFTEWIDKGFVSPVKDQMLCGGCWAFATCGSLADRLALATNGRWYAPFGLSEQVLISCGGDMGMDFYDGCGGGIPHFSIDALTKEGVPMDSKCPDCASSAAGGSSSGGAGGGVVNPNNTDTCKSGGTVYAKTNYTFWQNGCDSNTSCGLTSASTCPCAAIKAQLEKYSGGPTSSTIKYKTTGEAHGYTAHGENDELHTVDLWPDIPKDVIAKNVIRMKKAIYYEGPITVGYRVTEDFYNFTPTIDNYYKYCNGTTACAMRGGHAVVIVGWKKIQGTPVWIVKNSWGANWGYGFPNGPKWTDPITGKEAIKYVGGFWNHIMGENDSFIESNAEGAHPNLHTPEIAQLLPNNAKDIPMDWPQTMTLRDIYKMSQGQTPTPQPQPNPQPSPQPTPGPPVTPVPQPSPGPATPSPAPITINIPGVPFAVIPMTQDNITPQSIQKFFDSSPDNLYMIGSDTQENVNKIAKLLPTPSGKGISQPEIEKLIVELQRNVSGYIVIAARGDINNYWYLYGDPSDWNSRLARNFAKPTATIKKLVFDIYGTFVSLTAKAPIYLLSKK